MINFNRFTNKFFFFFDQLIFNPKAINCALFPAPDFKLQTGLFSQEVL